MNDQNMFRRPVTLQDDDSSGGVLGGAIILCALAALCILVLNLMAMSRASASARLSEAAASETAGYYQACLGANQALSEARQRGFVGVLDQSYRISDIQELRVVIDMSGNGDYQILEWRSVSIGVWNPDQSIDVIK